MSHPEMDVLEKIQSLEFSLRTICAVNVVHQILDSVGVKRKDYRGFEAKRMLERVTTEASKRVEKLNLPTRVEELLAGLIKPIYSELDILHNTYLFDVCAKWNPLGTVDMVQSTRAVVDDPKLKRSYRFKVACTFCHEQRIFELAQQLTDLDMEDIVAQPDWEWSTSRLNPNSTYHSDPFDFGNLSLDHHWRPLTMLWMRVIKGGAFHLTPQMLNQGLFIALSSENETAAMYFLGKDPEGQRSVLNEFVYTQRMFRWKTLSPATLCTLFSNIIDLHPRQTYFDDFVLALLKSLVSWPYQPLFLDAALSLRVHDGERTFSELLKHIVGLAVEGFKDFDYRGLYVRLWETIVSIKPGWCLGKRFRHSIVLRALETEDELWINVVCDKLSDREKERLLLDDRCYICARLILERKIHLLQRIIGLCEANMSKYVVSELQRKIGRCLQAEADISRHARNRCRVGDCQQQRHVRRVRRLKSMV